MAVFAGRCEADRVCVSPPASKSAPPLAGPRRRGYDPPAPTTPPSTYLGQRFADYGAGWPTADHADAMACRDLEERLAYGLALYRLAQGEADAVGRRVAESGVVYDREGASYVEALLKL